MAATAIMKIPCKIVELSLDISLNCGQSFRLREKNYSFCFLVIEIFCFENISQMEKVIEWRVDGCIGRICVANDPGWELHQLSCCQTLRHQKWTATSISHKEERIEGMYWLWANIERLLSIGYWFGKSLQAMVFSWCKFQSSSQELCGSTNAEAGPRWKPVCIHLLIKQQHPTVCFFHHSISK